MGTTSVEMDFRFWRTADFGVALDEEAVVVAAAAASAWSFRLLRLFLTQDQGGPCPPALPWDPPLHSSPSPALHILAS